MPDPSTSFPAAADLFRPAPRRARVLLPLPLGGAYDYVVPDGMVVEPGSFVRVPLGNRSVPAVVWDAAEDPDDAVAEHRLKPIAEVYEAPPMLAPLRRLVDWIASYTLTPPGAVLRMAIGPLEALSPAE